MWIKSAHNSACGGQNIKLIKGHSAFIFGTPVSAIRQYDAFGPPMSAAFKFPYHGE